MDNFRDASGLQRMVLIVLDYLNAGNLRVDVMRNSVLEQISNRLASMVPRHRMLHPATAERYSGYAVIVRQLMVMEMKLELAYEDERKCEKKKKMGNTGPPRDHNAC